MAQPCLCRDYPGCKGRPESGQKLCPVCVGNHHRAYTDRQLAAFAKRKAS